MKAIALQLAGAAEEQRLNVLREYLQNYLLFLMQKVGMMESLCFVGGTALRFLYRIRRYSEDLDFSADEHWSAADFTAYMKKIETGLHKAGYVCTLQLKGEKVVQKAKIGFSQLLFEVGLSHRKEQKVSIHLEIDANPPPGWKVEKTIVDLHLPVALRHYEISSMFAGKLHAIFMRPYTKGRDIYDLFWYRSKQKDLLPNFTLLNNAIVQTAEGFPEINEANWLELLTAKLDGLDWNLVEKDVLPFLEFREDLMMFTKENLLALLKA